LFRRAVAVVVDSGGAGSHAAIVAREYGISAAMGTGTVTAILADCHRVTVDANAGVVVEADHAGGRARFHHRGMRNALPSAQPGRSARSAKLLSRRS
jgi:phosphoenolpyruvate-protein kinase (PTS system EI component)